MDDISPRLIVGLGNPGSEYETTRHNVGCMVIDRFRVLLKGRTDAPVHTADSLVWQIQAASRKCLLQKPLTFMNESGSAVAKLSRTHDVETAEVMVVSDDVELPLGRLRLRSKGGSGGHRGLESITEHLGCGDFQRLRIGVGPQAEGVERRDYVLDRFRDEELATLEPVLKAAAEALMLSLHRGITVAMNAFNGWEAETTEEEAED